MNRPLLALAIAATAAAFAFGVFDGNAGAAAPDAGTDPATTIVAISSATG